MSRYDNTRVQWIDTCRGLAIFLVLLGHTLKNDVSYVYIYSFHMPLFFFLSGLVLNRRKYTFSTFFKSRFNTLILPYVFFYLLTYIYWLLIESHFRSFDMVWYKPLFGMVYAGQYDDLMNHNGILWFLPCLFIVEMLFFALGILRKKNAKIVVIVLMLVVGSQIKTVLPWCLNIAMCALPFFYTGYMFKQIIMADSSEENNIVRILFWVTVYVGVCYFFPNRIAMATNFYGNILLFAFLSFTGIGVMVLLSKIICCPMVASVNKCDFQYLGSNTLIIFALHQPLLRILTFVGKKLFDDFPLETNILVAIVVDIAAILCLLPLIKMYKMFVEPQLRKLYL